MPNPDPSKTSNANTPDPRRSREQPTPKHPWPEGPGGPKEAKGVSDGRNKSTRRGER